MKTTPAQLQVAVAARTAEAAAETEQLDAVIAREAAITKRGYALFAESRRTDKPISLAEGKRLAALEIDEAAKPKSTTKAAAPAPEQ